MKFFDMKKLVVFLLFGIVVLSGFGQVAKPLQFKEETFDFGTVIEKDGPVTHQFEFTNNSNRPVKILSVKPSCGCTTPDWTKDSVLPGKTGFIKAQFDPKGRPGYFLKTLAVTTYLDGTAITLQIKGTVSSDSKESLSEFSVSSGNLKLRSGSFNLGKIYLRDEFVTREFEVLNAGEDAITLTKAEVPAHIKVVLEPASVAPGAKGMLKLSYNGKVKNQYGFQSDNIVLHTTDREQTSKSFAVYATLEDYFPMLTPEESAKAPKLRLQAPSMDFGRVKQHQETSRDLVVTNAGKTVLELRSIQGNCSCITTSASKTSLKAGESTIIKITFNPEDRKGTQQKAVVLYTNDPQNPVQRVTFTAYVED